MSSHTLSEETVSEILGRFPEASDLDRVPDFTQEVTHSPDLAPAHGLDGAEIERDF